MTSHLESWPSLGARFSIEDIALIMLEDELAANTSVFTLNNTTLPGLHDTSFVPLL